MRITVNKIEEEKPLVAIYSTVTGNLYFKSYNKGGSISYLDALGKLNVSSYKSLESIMSERNEHKKLIPIYKGDSVTITF